MHGCDEINASDSGSSEGNIRFLSMIIDQNGTYEIYHAKTAAQAHSFLDGKQISQKFTYIIVDTPEGRWGKDVEGLYLWKLLPFQLNIDEWQCEGTISGIPSFFSLRMAAKGISDNFVANVVCGNCGHSWADGLRYRNKTIVICPECKYLNLVDSGPFIIFA